MGKSSQKQTQESSPWAPAIPQLKENLATARGLYGSQDYIGMTPEQKALIGQQLQSVQGQQTPGATVQYGQDLLGGRYTPQLNGVGGLNLSEARAAQGTLDPTQALQRALSGQPNMDVLGKMQQANASQGQMAYQNAVDAAGRMFTEQINPAIRNTAIAQGQYGGSRGQLAQGVAARDIGEQLAKSAENLAKSNLDYGNQLYGGAYQNAQQTAANLGLGLNQQAAESGQYNANLDLQRTLLQPQLEQQAQAQGLQALGSGEQAQLQQLQQQYGLQGTAADEQRARQQFDWDQLSKLAGLTNTTAGLGGTSPATTTQNQGALASLGTGVNLISGIAGLFQ